MIPEAVQLPRDWKPAEQLHDLLMDAVREADCCWLQTATGLGFALAAVLASEDDDVMRVAVAEKIAAAVLEFARTGQVPGGKMQ